VYAEPSERKVISQKFTSFKMTAILDVRFKRLRPVIELLVTKNVKPIDIRKRLLVVYGNETIDVRPVRRRVLRVKGSEVGKGGRLRSTGVSHKQKVDDLIRKINK